MKYKEKIQATATITEVLRFHTTLLKSSQQIAAKLRSHMRRFSTQIYGRHTFLNGLIFCWMNDVNKTI